MVRFVVQTLVVAALGGLACEADHPGHAKLDALLHQRAHTPRGVSDVIVRTGDGHAAAAIIRQVGGVPGRQLSPAAGQAARVPDGALEALAGFHEIASIGLDRPVKGAIERTAVAIGARWATESLGLDGAGVGIATIDSGVTLHHDDLAAARVTHFVDFVGLQSSPYDDYGHGTHVAGIIAGSGYDSGGRRRGVAPAASLVVLKALDGAGSGYISNVIAAIDYAIANRDAYNIRVINLSVAAGVYESYDEDPLTLAAKRAVDAGIVVIAAAGNHGRDALGSAQYGGIASPGNAPWVLTVGAATHMGTADRGDDRVAPFSSRGPSAIDNAAKPDLVAPGVGIESTADSSSLLYAVNVDRRVWGTVDTISQPYLRMSGTSMAAPVVAGTVALMLQANPALTPNAVKAILQFTAESREGYDHLTQGAGFLNARGAVQLARGLARSQMAPVNDPTTWGRRLVWGNQLVSGGTLAASANAWSRGVVWGASATPDGEPIVWGTRCDGQEGPCRPWQVRCEVVSTDCTGAAPTDGGDASPLCDAPECYADVSGGPDGAVFGGSAADHRKPGSADHRDGSSSPAVLPAANVPAAWRAEGHR